MHAGSIVSLDGLASFQPDQRIPVAYSYTFFQGHDSAKSCRYSYKAKLGNLAGASPHPVDRLSERLFERRCSLSYVLSIYNPIPSSHFDWSARGLLLIRVQSTNNREAIGVCALRKSLPKPAPNTEFSCKASSCASQCALFDRQT